MGFDLSVGISAVTVFLQGLLSVFSPCVLPLIPLYIGYLAGGTAAVQPDGTIRYPRRRVLVNTLFFVLGISFAFFLLGMGFTALGRFFSGNRTLFTRCSGVLILVFGLYQLGIFGRSSAMDSEHRFHLPLNRLAMNPLTALLLGFTFSFAWTPCVGPALSGVLLMASSAPERGFLLIGVYTLGFVIPFLLVGLFTGTVLDLFKKYHNVVRYTTRIGAVLLILMGLMTLTGFTGRLSGVLSQTGGSPSALSGAAPQVTATPAPTEEPETDPDAIPAPDFTLVDQYGEEHTLSEYRGKTVFLNFWATWCGPCQSEMPEIQSLYESYGSNGEDLIVLGVANPSSAENPRAVDGSIDEVSGFLSDNGYTFPVVMDTTGDVLSAYGISAFPTTFMIDTEGNVFGYVTGQLTADMMESIVTQTMTGQRVS